MEKIEDGRTSIMMAGNEVMATVRRTADEQASFVPHDHTLVHVAKGELEVSIDGSPALTVGEGECVFVRKDYRLRMRRKVDADSGFHLSIFIYFPRKFLFDSYRAMTPGTLLEGVRRGDAMLKMEKTPAVASLFESFRPYYYSGEKPDCLWLDSRMDEALRIVLGAHPEACASLFSFATPYRPDLLEFIEEYYACDLTVEEMAAASGRSTATFKRDFARLGIGTPQRWVINRRLAAARERLLTTDVPVGVVMAESGFRNFSHFSRVYKARYGESPSATRKK